MTVEEYKERAAPFRAHMEDRIGPDLPSVVWWNKEPELLPGGNHYMKVIKPPLTEDLSHLNPSHWMRHQRTGKMNKPIGRPKKKTKPN